MRTVIVFVVLVLVGCIRKEPDRRLLNVDELSDSSPEAALDSLYAIDYERLSSSDRHFYDFLSVKITDKAYLKHASDSLIQDVIDYESRHMDNGRYAESLYYGGRVYKDLGDYPTSMRYFQEALEEVPSDEGHLDLKANIASQYGRLLNELRLYDRAIPQILTSLKIDSIKKDSVYEVYDLQLLGNTQMRAGDYLSAEKTFHKALLKGRNLPDHIQAKSAMYMAENKVKIGELDSALSYIRDVPNRVNTMVYSSALASSARIYCQSGILDSAYLYAHELITNPDPLNKVVGYQIILLPELRTFVNDVDTVHKYISDYSILIEDLYDDNKNQLALHQESLYNYQLHVREKDEADTKNRLLSYCITGLAFVIFVLIIIVLLMRIRNRNDIIKLRAAIENIDKLRQSINNEFFKNTSAEIIDNDACDESDISNPKETEEELRLKLREKLLSIYNAGVNSSEVPKGIKDSLVYKTILDKISSKTMIKEDDPIWEELEKIVIDNSPNFKSNLKLLVGGNFSSYDIKTSLLIKCGISTGPMSILLNRTKGTIVSRRESMCERVFDQKLGTQVIDGIIRLL